VQNKCHFLDSFELVTIPRFFILSRRQVTLTSLVLTLTETLRYRGALGQWSWVAHRVSGLGVVLFLVLHVIGVAWAYFFPALWEEEVIIYQHPLFTIGEFALVACVVFHALNGLRISMLDYRPEMWKYQKQAVTFVLLGTVVILIPTFIIMFGHVLKHYETPPFIIDMPTLLGAQVRFVIGIVAAIVVAVLASGLYGLLAGNKNEPKVVGKASGSKVERFWWSYMRTSGLLIVPLVFGHLALAHLIQGVFDLNLAGAGIAGVPINETMGMLANGINNSGTAVEYVAERWNFMLGPVAVWRIYDVALLALVTVHGFNGLRYVLTDYTMSSPLLRRAMTYVCVIGAVVLLVMGTWALLGTIDQAMVDMAKASADALRGGTH
jgi:succinate dehydrogenase / fumarate reductase cytochrome b subunit